MLTRQIPLVASALVLTTILGVWAHTYWFQQFFSIEGADHIVYGVGIGEGSIHAWRFQLTDSQRSRGFWAQDGVGGTERSLYENTRAKYQSGIWLAGFGWGSARLISQMVQ